MTLLARLNAAYTIARILCAADGCAECGYCLRKKGDKA